MFDWISDEVWWVSQKLGWYEWFGHVDNLITKFICAVANPICLWSSSLIFDGDPGFDDHNRYQVYVAHSFKGISIKSLYHIAQNAKDGAFREFNYGN